ncbi:hypothetical protein B0H11DRAFT_2036838 [Mycena galericulata]|nr:hypothetical protein B0H11DRAFT_2036838 [Mycena galericulata]
MTTQLRSAETQSQSSFSRNRDHDTDSHQREHQATLFEFPATSFNSRFTECSWMRAGMCSSSSMVILLSVFTGDCVANHRKSPGVGETVRGTVLGTIDDWESKGERKHHDIARQGQVEMTEAYQRLWGSTSSSSAPVPSTEPRGYTSGYDAAPPTYQATGAASTSAGGDSKDASGI